MQQVRSDHQLHVTKLNSEISRLKLQLKEAEALVVTDDDRCGGETES